MDHEMHEEPQGSKMHEEPQGSKMHEEPTESSVHEDTDITSVSTPVDSIEIYVDYRETKLIHEFNNISQTVTTKNLELGDILIVSTGTYPFTLLFERKANNDLEASIKDRRYSEQKKRILSTYTPHTCTYIIEGLGILDDAKQSQYILNSAIIHTMYRDHMHVVYTTTLKHTAAFIKSVYDRCVAHPSYFCEAPRAEAQQSYISNAHNNSACVKIKSKKAENIDVATCYILQLCQIPGISHIIASEISKVYPTYMHLIDALRNCDTHDKKLKLLKSINMIAAKKAAKIIEYIQV